MKNSLVAVLWFSTGIAVGAQNPHEIAAAQQDESCLSCHATMPEQGVTTSTLAVKPDMAGYRGDGIQLCVSCHDVAEQSHKVGVTMDFTVPADLPLGEEQAITCLTCHYTHGSLRSDRPWASVSIMERLLNDERMSKSFLLRRNNVDGELCLTCHR